jgi:hypothetical protein
MSKIGHKAMSYTGRVEKGTIVLDQGEMPPEGARVIVHLINEAGSTVGARLLSLAGIVDDLPEDLAENHDHYLHGHPKR